MKSKFAYGILASVLIFAVVSIYWAFYSELFRSDNQSFKNQKLLNEKTNELILLAEASKYLDNFYRLPFDHELWGLVGEKCLKRYNLTADSAFRLSCSSEILSCLGDFLKESKKPFFIKDQKIINLTKNFKSKHGESIFEVKYPSETNGNNLAIKSHLLKLESANESMEVLLSSNCQESFLEERFYAVGSEPQDSSLEIQFDNFNKKIFIDKFQVRRGEVADWYFKNNVKKTFNDSEAFLPATKLKLQEMTKFCIDHGKQILQSHLYDAATFIPFDLKDKEPRKHSRGDYYWVKKNSDSWIFKLKRAKDKSLEKAVNLKNCSLLYGKECTDKFLESELMYEPTWSGLYQVMGGAFEYVRNVLVSEDNLRASSKYFSLTSSYQRLGERAFWDGEGFLIKNFIFKDEEKLPESTKAQDFEVAFRCYRQSI